MLRSFRLHCALGTLAVACGGSTGDDDLFGDAAGMQSGGTSAGGKTSASGGTSNGPAGGRAVLTGGRASSTGGAASSQGGDGEPATGGTGGGVPGTGGMPSDGGAGPGGAPGTGGAGGTSSGGSSPGGTANPSGGSPEPSGGMVSASGGISGGSGGGSGGGPIGKGGAGGTASCQEARDAANMALLAAQACDDSHDDQCLGFVDGECCPVPVNDPSSPEALDFQAALAHMNKVCGASICPAVLCVAPSTAVCQSKGSEPGRCVSKSVLAM